MSSTCSGYGFVQEFANLIAEQNYDETHVDNVVVMWDYYINEKPYSTTRFSSSQLNMTGLFRERVESADHVISSGDEDVDLYVSHTFMWRDHFVAIPINGLYLKEDYLKAKGVILFLSKDENIFVSKEQLATLHYLINCKQPTVGNAKCVHSLKNELLTIHKKVLHNVGDRIACLSQALKYLAVGYSDFESGLKYVSVWKLNNGKNIEKDSIMKQYEAVYGAQFTKSSHSVLNYNDKHFLNRIRKSPLMGNARVIEYLTFDEVISSFNNKDFLSNLGLNEQSLSCIMIPVVISGSISSLDIFCLYIKDILYTPFASLSFAYQFQESMRDCLVDMNTHAKSGLVTGLMNTYFHLKDLRGFYSEIAKTIAAYNSVEKCLIYTVGTGEDLIYVEEEDSNEPSTFKSKRHKLGSKSLYVPVEYSSDKSFVEFLNNLSIVDKTESNTVFYRGERYDGLVKTALCISIQNSEQSNNSGIIILINKRHSTNTPNEKDYDVMTMDSAEITYLGALYLHQFWLWNDAVTRKNYLLRKLRHEIPHCTSVINNKISEIRQELNKREYIVPSVFGHTNIVDLNCNRIYMLSKFFGAVDYDDNRFAEGKNIYDIVEIISSYLYLFKEEAKRKGCDVIFNKYVNSRNVKISDYYPLAIVNLVTNAIRYSSEGTNIIIELYENRLEVIDMGIGIKDYEMDLIYKDGYRGLDAKDIDSQGMGYGLHITNRVLSAHGSTIESSSYLVSNHNYILEREIYDYLKALKPNQRQEFMYRDTEDAEKSIVNGYYHNISKQRNPDEDEYSEFYNRTPGAIKEWIENDPLNLHPLFIEMDDTWFSRDLNKVTFIINFNDIVTDEENFYIG